MVSLAAAPLLNTLSQPLSAFADNAQKLPKGGGGASLFSCLSCQVPVVWTSHCEINLCVCAGYEEFAGKLIGALQDAIEADLSDMEERQVPS